MRDTHNKNREETPSNSPNEYPPKIAPKITEKGKTPGITREHKDELQTFYT
jgi:hypothetical protein